jgi:hypothetical protein
MRGLFLPLLFASSFAHAQQTPPPAPPPSCPEPEYRQFDFWLGQWNVIGGPKADRLVGRSSITQVSLGCALAEHWVNSNGMDGHSLNVYDKGKGRWTQFWIGSDGVILRLAGGLQGADMVMEGGLPDAKGGEQLQRITWSPKADGTVVQTWQTSDDAGKSWQVSFRGIYHRMGAALPLSTPATP